MATNKSIIQARYDKAHTKAFAIKLNLVTDADIIEKLSSVPNVQAYIKQAIRADLARTCPEKADSVHDSEGSV